jgi:hypothetical protein
MVASAHTNSSDQMSLDEREPDHASPADGSRTVYKCDSQTVKTKLELSSRNSEIKCIWLYGMKTWSSPTGFRVMRNKDIVKKAMRSGNLSFQPSKLRIAVLHPETKRFTVLGSEVKFFAVLKDEASSNSDTNDEDHDSDDDDEAGREYAIGIIRFSKAYKDRAVEDSEDEPSDDVTWWPWLDGTKSKYWILAEEVVPVFIKGDQAILKLVWEMKVCNVLILICA